MPTPPDPGEHMPLNIPPDMPPHVIAELAQRYMAEAQARARGLGNVAIGRGQQNGDVPDYDDILPSSLYAEAPQQNGNLVALARGLARGLLAAHDQHPTDPRFKPDIELVEPGVRTRRADNHPLYNTVRDDRTPGGRKVRSYTRPRDLAVDHKDGGPDVIRVGWRLAWRQPVAEGQYIHGRYIFGNEEYDVPRGGENSRENPVTEIGYFLSTDGELFAYEVPKLAKRPTETVGYDGRGRPIETPVGNRKYTRHLRRMNVFQPNIMGPNQVQPFPIRGTDGGRVMLEQQGDFAGDEMIARVTEVACGGRRTIHTIIQEFADANGIVI